MNPRAAPIWRDLLFLGAFCLVVYAAGLTTHGLTNWQESQRALVVRDMQDPANPYNPGGVNWLVPTVNFQPYLAKPPLFYWAQLAIAESLSRRSGEFELRLTVALAGLLAVLATYIVTRRVLADSATAGSLLAGDRERWARSAAFWAGAFLSTGFLHVRSSRIGELDIMMVPFVVAAVGAVGAAWRSHRERSRTHWPAIVAAMVASAGAALSKGPPSLLAILAAAYGGIALFEAYTPRGAGDVPAWARRTVASLAALGTAFAMLGRIADLNDFLGAAAMVGLAGWLGDAAARLCAPARGASLFRALARTHPVLVLGTGLFALWGWGRLVTARIGADAANAWAQKETEDNLNILIPESPIKNLEAASYGVGLGSIIAIITLAWLAKTRPRLAPGLAIALAWVGLGFAGYSMLGKGVGRYLTPLWPGVAILAGLGAATLAARRPRATWLRPALLAAVIGLGAGQAWWYGWGREAYRGWRSPRAMMTELLAAGADPERMASFEFRTAALDFYAGSRVQPVGSIFIRDVTAGGAPLSLDDFAAVVRARGPFTVFLRTRQPADPYWDPVPAIDRLRAAGLSVEPLPTRARFVIDNGRIDVVAAHVSAP